MHLREALVHHLAEYQVGSTSWRIWSSKSKAEYLANNSYLYGRVEAILDVIKQYPAEFAEMVDVPVREEAPAQDGGVSGEKKAEPLAEQLRKRYEDAVGLERKIVHIALTFDPLGNHIKTEFTNGSLQLGTSTAQAEAS